MTREEYLTLYGKDSELTMWTIDVIKNWRRKLELLSGIECSHLEHLDEKANVYDYNHAKNEDCVWFKGYVNDLSILL